MFSTSQELREHLLCGKSAFYAKKEPVLYISISHYTFLYNIKVQYPIVKRGNSNEIYLICFHYYFNSKHSINDTQELTKL